MSNILDINSDSSDSEEDCDYVPSEDDLSELSVDENDGDDDEEAGTVPPETTANDKRGKKRENERRFCTEQDTVEKIQPAVSELAEKEHAENLWEDFLQDVNPRSQRGKCSSDKNDSKAPIPPQVLKSQEVKPKKITISEVYDFAGESVVVSKEVDECSEEAKNHKKETCSREETVKIEQEKGSNDQESTSVSKSKPLIAVKRASGLSSVIGSITNKKQKLSTLEKSLIDWKSFTKEEGLQEDLQHHKKSKGSYLENQAFLQRSDLRLFEIEKSVRLGNKTKR